MQTVWEIMALSTAGVTELSSESQCQTPSPGSAASAELSCLNIITVSISARYNVSCWNLIWSPSKQSVNSPSWSITAFLPWGCLGCCGRTQVAFGARYAPALLGQLCRVLGSFDSVLEGHPWSEKTQYLQLRWCFPKGKEQLQGSFPVFLWLFTPFSSVSIQSTKEHLFDYMPGLADYLQCHSLFLRFKWKCQQKQPLDLPNLTQTRLEYR